MKLYTHFQIFIIRPILVPEGMRNLLFHIKDIPHEKKNCWMNEIEVNILKKLCNFRHTV